IFQIVCCRQIGLPLTICGLAKVAITPLNILTKHELQIYEKLSYEAMTRHFCQTAVMRSAFSLDFITFLNQSQWIAVVK
ncbi:hypothetical protein, partial [Flavobacterium cyanobacteriorum]|uniref:hypothetical protein n=1 Tax=Flavobacterium cyanobacteriorum TaxID=2022802 RepID=UPI001A9CA64F